MNGSSTDTRAPVSVLSASRLEEDHASLRGILTRSRWELFETGTGQKALGLIRRRSDSMVICERTLPDADWTTLLGATVDMPQRPQFIVTSRVADHRLWADVLS